MDDDTGAPTAAPSHPYAKGAGYTVGSPRPKLNVLVGQHAGQPCVDVLSLYLFFRESAEWNKVAGDPDKVPGLAATIEALRGLYGEAEQVTGAIEHRTTAQDRS